MQDGTVVTEAHRPAVEGRTSSQTERTDPAVVATEGGPQAAEACLGTEEGPGQQAGLGVRQMQ